MDKSLENSSKNILEIFEQLKCPICLDIVDNIRELPCKHLFCFNCLETYKKGKNAINCPLCKMKISRRKILSRDVALESLCSLLRSLSNDIEVHHKTGIKTFFTKVPEGPIMSNFTNKNEPIDFVPQSSDEIIMPSTSKQDAVRNLCREQNLNESKFSIETAVTPNKLDRNKNSLIEEKTKIKSKIGSSHKKSRSKQDDSDIKLKPKRVSRKKISRRSSEKKRILKWLRDTRNQSDSLEYEYLELLNPIEKQLIDRMEDKIIDEGIPSGRNKTPNFSKGLNTENNNSIVKNADEDKLKNDTLKRSSYMKKESTIQKSLDKSKNNQENELKSSRKSMKTIKKTIGKKKVPKKTGISLLSTQKSNKMDVQTENTSDPLINIDTTVTVDQTLDFQKMEEYFNSAIPEMTETNVAETSTREIINEKDMCHKDSEANQDGKDNASVHQTQPLSEETVYPTTDKKSLAARLTELLKTILQQLTKEEGTQMNELSSLYPTFEGIFKIFDRLNHNKAYQSHKSRKHRNFSEDQNQANMHSLDGFAITPTAAFGSSIHKDVATQTTSFYLDCPHCSLGKVLENGTPTASSSLIMDIDTVRNVENGKKPSQSNFVLDQQCSTSKSQFEIANLQMKSSSLNDIEFMEQISVNSSMNKGHNNHEMQCHTQHNVSYNQPTMRKTSNRSQRTVNHSSSRHKNNSNKSKSKSRMGIDTSQGSGIMYSVPQSRVNHKLMLEKTMKESTELEQNFKRERTLDSTSAFEENPCKVKCGQFLQNDLSVKFDSESLHDNNQCSDMEIEEINQEHSIIEKRSFSPENSENLHTKTKHSYENAQADIILNYCDELIEKANKHILEEDLLSKQKHSNSSQILSENHEKNITNLERLNQSVTEMQVKTQQDIEKISQDLPKHYDELIEKATRQIEIENDDHHTQKLRDNYIKNPLTSKRADCLEEEENVEEKRQYSKTLDLLNDCNISIANTTKKIARNKMNPWQKESNTQSQNDQCQNLDQLDNVLEKETKGEVLSRDKFSESFGSCKEYSTNQTSSVENKTTKSNNLLYTPKRNISQEEHKIRRKKKNTPREYGDNSNEEIFSDVDVVDTSPQKSLSLSERLSCPQIVKRNSRMSSQIREDIENTPAIINNIPPPGFEDKILVEEKVILVPNTQNSERESESGIPNSISPRKFKVPSKRKRLVAAKVKTINFAVPQELTILCRDKSKNLNVKKIVRQSKFPSQTIVPKTNTSVLTSTSKQKSILCNVKSKLSQEASTSTSQKPKPCIAFTRLNHTDTLCVYSLWKRNLVTCQDEFGPDVTHMIVSVDKQNNVKYHTSKFISAIAAGIWVLNIKWVEECLLQNRIVDEEPFEVSDVTGIPSPRISRLTRVANPLFKGFKFYVPRSFAQASAEDVKNIIQLLQGVVVSSIEELKDKGEYTCIVISELVNSEDYDQYKDWLSSYKVLSVDINWLSLSVSRYKILSLRPHLLFSDDSIDELGYPSDLVVDVATSLTQNVTYD